MDCQSFASRALFRCYTLSEGRHSRCAPAANRQSRAEGGKVDDREPLHCGPVHAFGIWLSRLIDSEEAFPKELRGKSVTLSGGYLVTFRVIPCHINF